MPIATFLEINSFIKKSRTWFSIDTTPDANQNPQRWSYSTRDNGSVGDEVPGQEDIREARRLQTLVERQFSNVRVTVETCDEWTNLNLTCYPHRIPARPPTNLDLYQALTKAKMEIELETRLTRTGRWDKSLPRPYRPSTGQAAILFTDPARKRSIEFSIQVQKEGELAWCLCLCADDTNVPLKSLTPKALIQALDALEAATDGFHQTLKPTFLIARDENGKLTYRNYRSLQGFSWVENVSEATAMAGWEMESYVKNNANDPTLRVFRVTKGRIVKIEPFPLAPSQQQIQRSRNPC